MRQEDPPLVSSPLEQRGVVRASQPHVLNANQVDTRIATQHPADDRAIEVLVREELRHGSPAVTPLSQRSRAPCHQPLANALRLEPRLVLPPDGVGLLPALTQIRVHLRLAP